MPISLQYPVMAFISGNGTTCPDWRRTGLSIITAPTGVSTRPAVDSSTTPFNSSKANPGRPFANGTRLMPLN